jgi:hypothetical protein
MATAPQRSAWFFFHGNGHVTVMKDRFGGKLGVFGKKRLTQRLLAENEKSHIRVSIQRLGSAGNDDLRTEIATHGIERYPDHAFLILLSRAWRNRGQNTVSAAAYNSLLEKCKRYSLVFQSLSTAKGFGLPPFGV